MRSLRTRALGLGGVAAGLLIGGLAVGGVWYATTHNLTAGLFDASAGQITRVAQAVPNYPAGPTPTVMPGIAQYPAPSAKPNQTNSKRPAGEVTQISADPAAFTIRTASGQAMTFEVTNTTVFMAGHDRPYRFDLLKTGDNVVVRGGPDKVPVPSASPVPAGGKAKGTRNHTGISPRPATGESIARQVMVRPAGENARGGKGKKGPAAGAPTGAQNAGATGSTPSAGTSTAAQNGGTNGAGQ